MPATFRLLRGATDCPSGPTCDGVHTSDRGTLAVTGRQIIDPGTLLFWRIPPGHTAVVISASLAPELAAHEAVRLTVGPALIVAGQEITDPAERAQLRIGPGETAVEIAPVPALTPA